MCARAIVVQHVFHSSADKAIAENIVQLQPNKEKGERKRRKARARPTDGRGKEKDAKTLWAVLYADDAGIVSRSPNGLEGMMAVIVTACAALGLTVSEAKVEVMCLQMKYGGKVAFTVTAAGQVYEQTLGFCVLGWGYQRRLDGQTCRGNASTSEGMGVLRAV